MLRIQQPSRKKPTWSWDFAAKGSLPPGATYTGNGGNGTRFNSAGVLVQSVNNVARFDYDPVTYAPLGYLAEMASTNALTRSQEFDNAAWAQALCTVTANQIAAPDGTTTADKVTEDTSNNAHACYQRVGTAANSEVAFSCFFKAGTRSKFYICIRGTTNDWVTGVFDTAGGTTSATQTVVGATTGTLRATSMQSVGNGWYRCTVQGKVASASPYAFIGLATLATGNTFNANGDVTYTGDGASFGYFWGAQVDSVGVGVTSYIPTAGATVTRAVDLLTLPLTSLPGWSAAQGGVFTAAYRLNTKYPASPGYNQPPIEIQAADYQNSVQMLANYGGANQYGGWSASGGTVAIAYGGTTVAPFTRRKQSIGWTVNRVVNCADGGAPLLTVLAVALPVAPATMYLGVYGTFGHALGGALESIAYYRGARSDAFVQQVSR